MIGICPFSKQSTSRGPFMNCFTTTATTGQIYFAKHSSSPAAMISIRRVYKSTVVQRTVPAYGSTEFRTETTVLQGHRRSG
jgi:hypothetical protein